MLEWGELRQILSQHGLPPSHSGPHPALVLRQPLVPLAVHHRCLRSKPLVALPVLRRFGLLTEARIPHHGRMRRFYVSLMAKNTPGDYTLWPTVPAPSTVGS